MDSVQVINNGAQHHLYKKLLDAFSTTDFQDLRSCFSHSQLHVFPIIRTSFESQTGHSQAHWGQNEPGVSHRFFQWRSLGLRNSKTQISRSNLNLLQVLHTLQYSFKLYTYISSEEKWISIFTCSAKIVRTLYFVLPLFLG